MEESRLLMILQQNYEVPAETVEFLRESGGTTYLVQGGDRKFLLKAAGKAFWNTIQQSVDVMCFLSRFLP